ncbi:hypothetical protein ACI2LF_07870 [Kribbella sp. NPDC020789]
MGEDEAPPKAMEAPEDPARLYDDVGEVSPALPIMQGDIFRGVELPGIDSAAELVQIVMHPCSMRGAGGRLHPRITVAPIRPIDPITSQTWKTSGRYMPLPGLLDDDDSVDLGTHFIEITSAPAEAFGWSNRVAALSRAGVLILQQRLIWFHSRFIVPTRLLYRQSSPVLTELELQGDWVDAALNAQPSEDCTKIIDEATSVFQSWLDEDKKSRRKRLQEDAQHADLRSETRKEIALRYESKD